MHNFDVSKFIAELFREKTQEELREYVNPDGKLIYFGKQECLNSYCNKYNLNEGESFIYVLNLQGDMFYIGETTGIFNRFRRHFSFNPANYVGIEKSHPPISVCEIYGIGDADKHIRLLCEDALTMLYAKQYGKDRVRGGHFCNPDVSIAYSAEKMQQFANKNQANSIIKLLRKSITQHHKEIIPVS